jgi:FtsP/CotA-like multicopper oxidase with cupredoxin domain
MDPADVSDVTGSTYTFLVNGHGPQDNWTALFSPGERVRLRIINASAMTTFNVRIPGLTLSRAGRWAERKALDVDEFQIGVAETYDLVVRPADAAYTFVAEAVDRWAWRGPLWRLAQECWRQFRNCENALSLP